MKSECKGTVEEIEVCTIRYCENFKKCCLKYANAIIDSLELQKSFIWQINEQWNKKESFESS